MIKILLEKQARKRISWMLLSVMLLEMVCPTICAALSSGPVQPEIQSFEPVGTTDMVDLFTGDFVYNIPLMDVEGYPLNISYHGGITMEQEASWVGLGWNINPGAVNRSVRGLPDEFNGEMIEKEINIKEEINKKIGLSAGVEIFGLGDPLIRLGANLGGYLNLSNYRGVSVDFTSSAGVNTRLAMISAGLNIGASVGSQAGASIDYGGNIGVGVSQAINKDMSANGSFNLNYGGTYSPRTGLRRNVGYGVSLGMRQTNSANSVSMSTGTSVPIGLQNYTAAITNASYMNSWGGQVKVGGEIFGLFAFGKCAGSVMKIGYEPDGSRKGYGYFNLANADASSNKDLLDFSREKDGMYNTTMQLLPQSHLTYDIYSVSGQGTGGSFRPFRNDIGGVYDPYTVSSQTSENADIEAGIGNSAEGGGEYAHSETKSESGPWNDYKRSFTKKRNPGYYEDIYFKEAGELTANNESYLNSFANNDVVKPEDVAGIPLQKTNADTRIVRSNHIYTRFASDEDSALLLSGSKLISYKDTTGFKTYPAVNKDTIARLNRIGTQPLTRKANQVTEIVQTQKDGRRYIYGLPVVNNVQREVTFAVDTNAADNKVDLAQYLVNYTAGTDDSKANTKGLDNFYSSTLTPTYVTAHLLTSVLSADYADMTGNGISDDDLGTYTKFNYSRKSSDYRWRSPVQSGKAQYIPGYKTDKRDDKAAYMIGSREQWMLHSIETKNYVAEFYVSPRLDAQGVLDRIIKGGLPASPYDNQAPYNTAGNAASNKSYKLDSIALYNKHDRFINGANAKPIKTVLFSYDYSLCKNVPNGQSGSGKLTLKKIQTRYGTSNLNLSAAYKFTYGGLNPDYNELAKDRWGTYKPNDPLFNNAEFPFTKQVDSTNYYAAAWSLTEVGLPSGGVIKVDYESDDYAYVQDKEAMEMFKIDGFGRSPDYAPDDRLYSSPGYPNLYFYFTRRIGAENGNLSFSDNYLKGTDLLYYNVSVALTGNKFEPIKGYAQALEAGACADGVHGYIKVGARTLEGGTTSVSPVTYTALNVGRYNLPHILFPGSDPESSDIGNIVKGLKVAIKGMVKIASNPLANMMKESLAKRTDCSKSFVRLTSPGLRKKGGGQRVSAIRFYDNWDAMAQGNLAIYGKKYRYTLTRDDGRGTISSGVASYEPMIGGDELPQRVPVGYTAQKGNKFPPNDPVDLYEELPVGESFYPGAVVGYSNVTVTSINADKGRSSQTEDISGFYTAKDFPIQVQASAINAPKPKKDISITDITIEQQATQGFSLVFNDMHGKARNTEHWLLKPADTVSGRELINMQKYEYLTESGKLSNQVPVFDYNPTAGKLYVGSHKMGIETDLTIDTRQRKEKTVVGNVSFNTNGFMVSFVPVIIPLGYPFEITNDITFKCATVTKITQQYGILKKVTSSNEGAVTELRNEVFDINTGNALVTSVNNEFKDRVYNVSYPAYWAYKELGPSYANHNLKGTFANPMVIDSMGKYIRDFTNFNPAFSTQYLLPSNMPVARIIVDDEMPKFKLGDEMQVYANQFSAPLKTWTMGYVSDSLHCYLILTTREPYKTNSIWKLGTVYPDATYRVIRSGNKNRLGETIQSYTTTDSSNIFPYLKDTLNNLVSLNAQTYKHNLGQVSAANLVSDSLNPFLTGKVGMYRPEQQLLNMKKRMYSGGTTRNAGVFASPAYWRTERDNFKYYCQDSVICNGECKYNCPQALDSLQLTYLGGDSMRINLIPNRSAVCSDPHITLTTLTPSLAQTSYGLPANTAYSFVAHCNRLLSPPVTQFTLFYASNCCWVNFDLTFDGTNFTIDRQYYNDYPATNLYVYSPSHSFSDHLSVTVPYRIRKKILLGNVGHYDNTDHENWVKQQQVTKYNWFGQEIENREEGIGYNAAVYGYGQQLPVCVAKNARHSEVLFEGFEDYTLLKPKSDLNSSYMPLFYSPFESYFTAKNSLGAWYDTLNKAPGSGVLSLVTTETHSGNYALKANTDFIMVMNASGPGKAAGYTFRVADKHKYMISMWLRPVGTLPPLSTGYTPGVGIDLSGSGYTLFPKSNIIDGWQKFEAVFDVPEGAGNLNLYLKGGYYYDDLRLYPFESNSKGFVYDPVTRKLMATLDENNYATFYEYDAEGNLVRTKKETEKGIMTITESRSTHRKIN